MHQSLFPLNKSSEGHGEVYYCILKSQKEWKKGTKSLHESFHQGFLGLPISQGCSATGVFPGKYIRLTLHNTYYITLKWSRMCLYKVTPICSFYIEPSTHFRIENIGNKLNACGRQIINETNRSENSCWPTISNDHIISNRCPLVILNIFHQHRLEKMLFAT